MNLKEKWGALLALAGITTGAAATTPLTEANLEQLNAKAQEQADQLTSANALVATLTGERDQEREKIKAKETELATATGDLTKASEELTLTKAHVTQLENQVKSLGLQPGAMPTNPLNPNGKDESGLPPTNPIVNPNASHAKFAATLFGK